MSKDSKSTASYTTSDGKTIKEKEVVKDLGILMSNDGSFTDHIQKVCSVAKRISSWILRTFTTRERVPMLTLWKSLMQPHLDYCCQLWSPEKNMDINELEDIQRAFFRKIRGCAELNYWEQLKYLRMYSLQRRRLRSSFFILACASQSTTDRPVIAWMLVRLVMIRLPSHDECQTRRSFLFHDVMVVPSYDATVAMVCWSLAWCQAIFLLELPTV